MILKEKQIFYLDHYLYVGIAYAMVVRVFDNW